MADLTNNSGLVLRRGTFPIIQLRFSFDTVSKSIIHSALILTDYRKIAIKMYIATDWSVVRLINHSISAKQKKQADHALPRSHNLLRANPCHPAGHRGFVAASTSGYDDHDVVGGADYGDQGVGVGLVDLVGPDPVAAADRRSYPAFSKGGVSDLAEAGSFCSGGHDPHFLILLDYSYTDRYSIVSRRRMSSGKKSPKTEPKHKLDGKPYSEMVKKAGKVADRTLEHYGLPDISLDGLRAMVDQELRDAPLSELVLKDRQAGW